MATLLAEPTLAERCSSMLHDLENDEFSPLQNATNLNDEDDDDFLNEKVTSKDIAVIQTLLCDNEELFLNSKNNDSPNNGKFKNTRAKNATSRFLSTNSISTDVSPNSNEYSHHTSASSSRDSLNSCASIFENNDENENNEASNNVDFSEEAVLLTEKDIEACLQEEVSLNNSTNEICQISTEEKSVNETSDEFLSAEENIEKSDNNEIEVPSNIEVADLFDSPINRKKRSRIEESSPKIELDDDFLNDKIVTNNNRKRQRNVNFENINDDNDKRVDLSNIEELSAIVPNDNFLLPNSFDTFEKSEVVVKPKVKKDQYKPSPYELLFWSDVSTSICTVPQTEVRVTCPKQKKQLTVCGEDRFRLSRPLEEKVPFVPKSGFGPKAPAVGQGLLFKFLAGETKGIGADDA